MEPNGQLSDYRQHLVEALRQYQERGCRDALGSLRVFVNQECVGTLDCDAGSTSRVSSRSAKPIGVIELRTASGGLAGSLCPRDIGAQAVRFRVGPHTIEVSVSNQPDGGMLRAEFRPAGSFLQRMRRVASALLATVSRPDRAMQPLPGFPLRGGWWRAAVLAQGLLAVAVLFLVVDRLADRSGMWKTQQRVSMSAHASAAKGSGGNGPLARQEHKLARLVEDQAAVIRAIKVQQQEIDRLRRGVVAAERQSQKRHEAETLLLARLSSETDDRARMWDQIQRLTAAKEALSKDVAALETRAIVAEARRDNPVEPFKFWVSFQEGTPDKSIEELIKRIDGRKGPIDGGWYSVEVTLAQPQTPATFVESLKKTKIVKAVKTSLTATTGQ